MVYYKTIMCIFLAVASLPLSDASPVTLSGSPTSFLHLDSPSFHSFSPLPVTENRPHLFTHSEDFFEIGHPMATGKSSSNRASHLTDESLQAAIHAGRFGVELNRLAQVNKEQHDEFIAAGFQNDIFGVPQSLPAPLQHLSRRGGPVGGAPDIHELEGFHLDDALSHHEFSSFSVDSFPALFHDPDFDQLKLLSSDRRSRIVLPPKDSNKLVVIKKSQPAFHSLNF